MEPKELYSKKIVEAYRAISRHVVSGARGRAPAWPFSILETTIFYSKFFTRELLDVMRGLENKGLSRKKIAKMFYGPSAVSHWLYLAGFPFEGLNKKDVIEFIERTIDIIEFWRKEEPFCINWRNIIWDSNKVKKEVSRPKFIDARKDDAIAKIVGKINTIVWHYCILIQVGHRNYSHEFHGPYDIGDNELLFVREYFNLKPKEVWPFVQSAPFDKILILEIYKNLEIKVDMFNHIWASSSLTPHLQRFSIEVNDSQVLTKKEIKDMFATWVRIISKANAVVKGYTKKDWVEQSIKMKYWLLKPHKKILGKDWQAPKEVLTLAEKYREIEMMAKKAIQGQMKKIMGYSEEEAMRNITQMYLDNIYEGKIYF